MPRASKGAVTSTPKAFLRFSLRKTSPSVASIARFGRLLEAHIRFEEREVFEPTQHRLAPRALQAIAAACAESDAVTIVGGGDCGTLNEGLKHPEIEQVGPPLEVYGQPTSRFVAAFGHAPASHLGSRNPGLSNLGSTLAGTLIMLV